MKKLITILLLLPLFTWAQFTRSTGATVGTQTVISIPAGASGTQQALMYLPDDYFLPKNANKRYPLYLFLHGAGESGSKDISQMLNNSASLPWEISTGLKPYGIDPKTGDTIKWIIISPHCSDNTNCSYSYPQLKFTLPYLLQTYRVDLSCVWAGGLSAGGSGTWSLAMADTAFTMKYLTGIMPMANGGWDQNLAAYGKNLAYSVKNGLAILYTIGDQDPGYNPQGYFAYNTLISANALPGRYVSAVIKGGTHSTNVWNPPFYLNGRIFSSTMNSWTQMWTLRKNAAITTPPPPLKSIPHAVLTIDSPVINYPNSVIHLSASGSYATNGKIVAGDFYLDSGDKRVILSPSDSEGVCASGLQPGAYRFKLVVTDSLGNKDSAYATAKLNPLAIPVCPVCPPPVVCPPPRKVVSILVTLFGVTINMPLESAKITYSDGQP